MDTRVLVRLSWGISGDILHQDRSVACESARDRFGDVDVLVPVEHWCVGATSDMLFGFLIASVDDYETASNDGVESPLNVLKAMALGAHLVSLIIYVNHIFLIACCSIT